MFRKMTPTHRPEGIVRLPVDFDQALPMRLDHISLESTAMLSKAASFCSPYDWAEGRKAAAVAITCLTAVFASFAASAFAPCKNQLMEKWHLSSVTILSGIPVFTAAFALGPMVLAPLSELKGRKPVFLGSGILFVVSTIGCAVTESFAG